eukprot:362540-Chlamydomonas_euryale.AAC.7
MPSVLQAFTRLTAVTVAQLTPPAQPTQIQKPHPERPTSSVQLRWNVRRAAGVHEIDGGQLKLLTRTLAHMPAQMLAYVELVRRGGARTCACTHAHEIVQSMKPSANRWMDGWGGWMGG